MLGTGCVETVDGRSQAGVPWVMAGDCNNAPGAFLTALSLIQLAAFDLFDFEKVPASEQPKIISLPQSKREKVLSVGHCRISRIAAGMLGNAVFYRGACRVCCDGFEF